VGDPGNYTIDEARKLLVLYPTPSTTAQTTTLNGALSASATTIPVTATTGFGGIGWIKIDNEIIQYNQVDTTDFLGCTRGACNTTATTHLTSATVTWGDIMLFYSRLPKFNKNLSVTNSVNVTNGSPTVTGIGTNWLGGQNVYTGDYVGIGSISLKGNSETFPLTWYQIASVDSPTQITLMTNYAEVTATATNAIITSSSEMFEQDCPIVVAWAMYKICNIFTNPDKRDNARNEYNAEMSLAKERRNGPDNLNVIKNSKWGGRRGHIGPRNPPHFESFPNG
jgi:hypothetical protein